jgi:hypothetical protein
MRFTVELRVKDLEGSVHQTVHKKVLKIRSLSSRTASALGLNVALPKVLPNLQTHRDSNEYLCVFGQSLEVSTMNEATIIFSHVSSSGSNQHHRTWRFYVPVRKDV